MLKMKEMLNRHDIEIGPTIVFLIMATANTCNIKSSPRYRSDMSTFQSTIVFGSWILAKSWFYAITSPF